MQQCLRERRVQLAAQPSDGNLDDIGLAVEIHVPHLLGDFGPRQDLAVPAQQQGEQQELLGGQVQPLSGAGGLAAHQVHFKIGHAQDRGVHGVARRLSPAHQGLQTRHEFRKRKGFDQIVVRTAAQTGDTILDAVQRGQHQHGCGLARTQRCQQREAVKPRQHAIEHDGVVAALQRQVQPVHAVVGQVDDVALLRQTLAQVLGQLALVLDHENFHGDIVPSRRPCADDEFVICASASCRGRTSTFFGIAPTPTRPIQTTCP